MANYDAILVRRATDDFNALLVSDSMQSIDGVEVVSIVIVSVVPSAFGDGPPAWRIFAKYASDIVDPDQIDLVIDDALIAIEKAGQKNG